MDFTVNILKSCIDATLTIAPSTLTATPVNYEITAGAQTETFVQTAVSSSTSEATCPTTYDYFLVNQDLTAIDSAVFVLDGSFVLTISTSDVLKVAAYPLKL